MLDEPVSRIMRKNKMLSVGPGELVAKAAQRMARRDVGAVLVVEDAHLLGIFTERDVLVRVVAKGLDASRTRVAAVMTANPITIEADLPFGYALLVMHREGFRHLPVVKGGKTVGIISARSALDPELEEFASEVSRRKHFARMAAGEKNSHH